jgi:SIR2-like domain
LGKIPLRIHVCKTSWLIRLEVNKRSRQNDNWTCKLGRIAGEPLLEWYLSLFKEALEEGDKNLVIVGYGFGDDHINDIIVDAIKDRGLKLFVISPQLPADFAQLLQGVSGLMLLNSIRTHFVEYSSLSVSMIGSDWGLD